MNNIEQAIEQLTKAAKEQGIKLTITAEKEPQPKSVVPDSWEDLGPVSGFCGAVHDSHKDVFATEELAQAALAIAQLSQLMYRTWDNDGGWRPEEFHGKAIISAGENIFGYSTGYSRLLQFRTQAIAQEFITKHRDLIEQAAPILFGRVTE
jgi:hypothetical protein